MNPVRSEVCSEDFSPPHPDTTTEVVTTNLEVGGIFYV
jgi:hypothetical protein